MAERSHPPEETNGKIAEAAEARYCLSSARAGGLAQPLLGIGEAYRIAAHRVDAVAGRFAAQDDTLHQRRRTPKARPSAR